MCWPSAVEMSLRVSALRWTRSMPHIHRHSSYNHFQCQQCPLWMVFYHHAPSTATQSHSHQTGYDPSISINERLKAQTWNVILDQAHKKSSKQYTKQNLSVLSSLNWKSTLLIYQFTRDPWCIYLPILNLYDISTIARRKGVINKDTSWSIQEP